MIRPLLALTRLLPGGFERRFGAPLRESLAMEHHIVRRRGRIAAGWWFVTTLIDLARSVVAERVRPSWIDPHHVPPRRKETRDMLDQWLSDVRHAARALRRSPGFTLVAAGTLGLAIGANTGIFSVVDTVLLHPLPYANADRLVHIAASAPGSDMPEEFGVSNDFFVHYRERSRLLEDVSTYNSFTSTVRTAERVERIRMSMPTPSLFTTLGVRPILGRLPVDEDGSRVFVMSYAMWQSWFGGDSSVIGRSFDVSGDRRTAIGIMGASFRFPDDNTMLWFPAPILMADVRPGQFSSNLVARIAPGATRDQVADELTRLSKELPARFGGTPRYAQLITQHRAVVRDLGEEMLGPVSRALWILFGAFTLVLLIACANVANLFLVRAEGRQRELAVRRAVGAGRGKLVRLQLSEAGLVALLAGGLATLLTVLTLPAMVRAAPPGVFRISDASAGPRTLAFTALAAIATAMACGLYPAIRASAPDLQRLREGGRGATRGRRWVRDALVVGQTALALVLLIGSGLLIRSFQKLRSVDPGYTTEDLFTFQIAPEGPHLRDGLAYARFSMDFMERLRRLPGVEQVGLLENVPLNEGTPVRPIRTEQMTNDPDAGIRLDVNFAAGDIFSALQIAVRAGQVFPPRELEATRTSVVVSTSAAEKLWPGRDPLGQRLQLRGDSAWYTVIGVVEDVLQNDYRGEMGSTIYLPIVGARDNSWMLPSPAYVVKTSRAATIATEIRALVRELAPEAPMYRTFTMSELAARSMIGLSFTMLTLGVASTLALILGAVGLYGVLSYVVAERTREIGVRLALGARADQVRRMVVIQGTRVVGIGAALGLLGALASTRFLGSLLFGVPAMDAMTFIGMSASMLVVGLLASYIPARRASSVAPIESLRGD